MTTALEAFGNGGLFGRGPGEGRVKDVLPDAHADFVFAVAGEEFGMMVCLVIIGVFAFIVLRGLLRLLKEQDLFIVLACTGLVTGFGLQAFVNMASSLELIPTKGMTLPFISYGGSSVHGGGAGHGHAAGADAAAASRGRAMRGPAVHPIVIAAGGTGGHFFPAEALASELFGARAAHRADDRRALGRPAQRRCSLAHERFVIRGAGIAGRGVLRARQGGGWRWRAAWCRRAASWRGIDAAAVVGFGGYPSCRAGAGGAPAARSRPPVILHEQNAVLGRANRFLARHADVLALSFAATERVPGDRGHGGHRQSGASRRSRRLAESPLCAADRHDTAAGAGRLARRARVQRRGAGGAGVAARRLAGAAVGRAAVPAGGPGSRARRLCAGGIAAELAAFFPDVAEQSGARRIW